MEANEVYYISCQKSTIMLLTYLNWLVAPHMSYRREALSSCNRSLMCCKAVHKGYFPIALVWIRCIKTTESTSTETLVIFFLLQSVNLCTNAKSSWTLYKLVLHLILCRCFQCFKWFFTHFEPYYEPFQVPKNVAMSWGIYSRKMLDWTQTNQVIPPSMIMRNKDCHKQFISFDPESIYIIN